MQTVPAKTEKQTLVLSFLHLDLLQNPVFYSISLFSVNITSSKLQFRKDEKKQQTPDLSCAWKILPKCKTEQKNSFII